MNLKPRVSVLATLFFTCASSLVPAAAHAGVWTIYDSAKLPWTVTAPVNVTITGDQIAVGNAMTTDPNNLPNAGGQTNTLTITVKFEDPLTPVTINFAEFKATQDTSTGTKAGLNFVASETLQNRSSLTWVGLHEQLFDRDKAPTDNDKDHPNSAHFHRTANGNPLVQTSMNNPGAFWATYRDFGNGMVAPNNDETITNLQIHDVFIKDLPRNFDLIIDPTPEPGTLVLLGMGTLGLVSWSHWRRGRCR